MAAYCKTTNIGFGTKILSATLKYCILKFILIECRKIETVVSWILLLSLVDKNKKVENTN